MPRPRFTFWYVAYCITSIQYFRHVNRFLSLDTEIHSCSYCKNTATLALIILAPRIYLISPLPRLQLYSLWLISFISLKILYWSIVALRFIVLHFQFYTAIFRITFVKLSWWFSASPQFHICFWFSFHRALYFMLGY